MDIIKNPGSQFKGESKKFISKRPGFLAMVFICIGTILLSLSLLPKPAFALGIGDSYQGGIVAYILQPGDPGYTAGQTKGLITTITDQTAATEWGCFGTAITGADGIAIGTGNQNTIDIMAGCGTAGIAARLAGDLVEGGYSDWYLPSKDELDKLYLNMEAIGGFTVAGQYWSSSEHPEDNTKLAWDEDLSVPGDSGGQFFDYKDNTFGVRAVRSFTIAPSVPGIPQATIGTNLTSQNWSWTASTDAGLGMKQYDWRVDSVPSGTTYSGTTITPTVITNLATGNWKFYVKAEDNSNNQSAENSSLLSVFSSSVYETTIDCSVPLATIVVPSSVSNAKLNLTPLATTVGDLVVADVSCGLFIKTLILPFYVSVEIPAGAKIKAPASLWTDKVIIPPVPVTPSADLLPAGATIALAVEVGHSSTPLDITLGTRIFMSGQAGKKAGYISNNVFTKITSTCADDSQTTGDNLTANGSCKIDSSSGLVIWTKHFSDFITYDLNEEEEEENEEAHIDSWKAYQYENPNTSCVSKLKLTIKGKHFDKDAKVRIGSEKASSVDVKSSKKITAKFCLTKLLEAKADHERTIAVKNSDADVKKANKKIDLDNILPQSSFDDFNAQTEEGIKNIQKALSQLGFLDQQYITGFYGSLTTEAVKNFQSQNNLPQIGTVGPLTKAKLVEKLE